MYADSIHTISYTTKAEKTASPGSRHFIWLTGLIFLMLSFVAIQITFPAQNKACGKSTYHVSDTGRAIFAFAKKESIENIMKRVSADDS